MGTITILSNNPIQVPFIEVEGYHALKGLMKADLKVS